MKDARSLEHKMSG